MSTTPAVRTVSHPNLPPSPTERCSVQSLPRLIGCVSICHQFACFVPASVECSVCFVRCSSVACSMLSACRCWQIVDIRVQVSWFACEHEGTTACRKHAYGACVLRFTAFRINNLFCKLSPAASTCWHPSGYRSLKSQKRTSARYFVEIRAVRAKICLLIKYSKLNDYRALLVEIGRGGMGSSGDISFGNISIEGCVLTNASTQVVDGIRNRCELYLALSC